MRRLPQSLNRLASAVRHTGRPSLAGLCTLILVLTSGCTVWRRDPTPGRTTLPTPLVVVPTTLIANVMLVDVNADKREPWRFLVDTGSSVTLVSPEFSARYAVRTPEAPVPQIRVRSANGGTTTLRAVTVQRLTLGDARFDRVPALVYDFEELSAHFGVKIDGVLGFPLFRQTLLTLDYPQSRLVLSAAGGAATLQPGTRIAFDTQTKTPLIPIEINGQTLVALIDSGSDSGLHLNPIGLVTKFSFGPRPGGVIASLAGERPQEIGRLAGSLRLGNYTLDQPVVNLTDELSAIGGSVLRNFVVTFDQTRGDVTFFRGSTAPIVTGPQLSAGLSFSRTPAYWRVVAVVPGSPAETAGVQVGDLVTRIDDEPVSSWPLQRFEARVLNGAPLDLTFLNGLQETTLTIAPFPLVP